MVLGPCRVPGEKNRGGGMTLQELAGWMRAMGDTGSRLDCVRTAIQTATNLRKDLATARTINQTQKAQLNATRKQLAARGLCNYRG